MGNKKTKSLKRPVKRIFTGNRFTQAAASAQATAVGVSEAVPVVESASKRKLSFELPRWIAENDSESDESSDSSSCSLTSRTDSASSDDSSLSEDDHRPVAEGSGTQASGDRLVNLSCLQNLISATCVCKNCGGEVTISEDGRWGLASTITISCCSEECLAVTSLPIVQKSGHFFQCNRRSVLAARAIGCGHAGLQKFCGLMNLPPPVQLSAFQRHQRALCKAAKSVACTSMNKAAEEVRVANTRRDRPVNVTAVTFDGTWMKRGFSSLHGVFTAIDWELGKVLDVHVATRYCQGCSMWKARRELGKISSEQYQQWKADHDVLCSRNTDRSSPGMETEAAVILWSRSVQDRGLEYHTYIGDGDSKGASAVREAKPYGPNVEIVKEECVGHIQKRLGSGLRKLKKEWAGKKLPDGQLIRGAGRLTDDLIDRLQLYYGNAIRAHVNNLQGMARSIWAGPFHRRSSDAVPRHQYCPTGADSWCGWQRVVAGAQETYQHHDVMPTAIFDVIKPVYVRLSEKPLLERCLRGATQNQNESFNGLIWHLCPKTSFCGVSVVELSTYLAVLNFNDGAVAMLRVLREMGCEAGYFTKRQLSQEDEVRVAKSEKKIIQEEKQRRKLRRRRRKGIEEQIVEVEGVTYEPGGF